MKIHVIDQQGREHVLDALEGWRVMEVIRDWGLPMKAECGGAACCGTCHVRVDEAWHGELPEPQDDELDMLDTLSTSGATSRLSCQNPPVGGHGWPEGRPRAGGRGKVGGGLKSSGVPFVSSQTGDLNPSRRR